MNKGALHYVATGGNIFINESGFVDTQASSICSANQEGDSHHYLFIPDSGYSGHGGYFQCLNCGDILNITSSSLEEPDIPLLERELDSYTTTEGLLLIILITIFAGFLYKLIKGAFSHVY